MIPRFRVFDKVENLMIYTYEDVKYDYGTGSFNSRDNILYVTEHYPVSYLSMFFMFLEQMKDTDQLVLMQSTGLFDKNGVEIFEGDIVRWKDFESFDDFPIDEVLKVEYSDEFMKWIACYRNCLQDDLYDFTDNRDLEVIGNVHETPELVEVEE